MDVPVNEPGEDEPTGSIDNLGSVTLTKRRFGANVGYIRAADLYPAV